MDKIEKVIKEIMAEEKRTGKRISYGMYVALKYPPKLEKKKEKTINDMVSEINRRAALMSNKSCSGKYKRAVPWSESEVEELRKLVKAGKTTREISEKLGRTMNGVYKKIFSEGLGVERSKFRRKLIK